VGTGLHGLRWGVEARQTRRRLAAAERDAHPWSQGRRRVVAAQLERLDIPAGATALDAGCGGGLLLAELARHAEAYGVDADAESVALARAAVGDDRVQVARLEALPFPDARFDLVMSMDVLEHLDDDRAALRELRRVTRPGGRMLVSVPALPALFSSHDVAAGHRRRYRRRDLVAAAGETGWRLREAKSFNSFLLPVAAVARLATRRSPPESDVRRAHGPAARAIEIALGVEARLLRAGVRLPIGLSLLAVFERED
jgi:2-polyprenyl-3-methyl-5-hydroxy-6-metoxy-1,4-benzoquinol methylase